MEHDWQGKTYKYSQKFKTASEYLSASSQGRREGSWLLLRMGRSIALASNVSGQNLPNELI